ncbi:HypC/HybG/HupF family hydrogenase formation chaperone [candidate division KSB1 bacterium]|nr:HypC/HybG/HupF family hydrogenase formation chaperone [candidate division KSB1 bacterium]
MCLAIPGKIIQITQQEKDNRLGKVNFAGVVKVVNLTYVPQADVGDYVTVHVGFALNVMDQHDAELVISHLNSVSEQNEAKLDKVRQRIQKRSGRS